MDISGSLRRIIVDRPSFQPGSCEVEDRVGHQFSAVLASQLVGLDHADRSILDLVRHRWADTEQVDEGPPRTPPGAPSVTSCRSSRRPSTSKDSVSEERVAMNEVLDVVRAAAAAAAAASSSESGRSRMPSCTAATSASTAGVSRPPAAASAGGSVTRMLDEPHPVPGSSSITRRVRGRNDNLDVTDRGDQRIPVDLRCLRWSPMRPQHGPQRSKRSDRPRTSLNRSTSRPTVASDPGRREVPNCGVELRLQGPFVGAGREVLQAALRLR